VGDDKTLRKIRIRPWKPAFDENFGELSPGVRLTLAMSRGLESDGGLSMADSCADPNHPMIDRL
jgi:hypothetical protein